MFSVLTVALLRQIFELLLIFIRVKNCCCAFRVALTLVAEKKIYWSIFPYATVLETLKLRVFKEARADERTHYNSLEREVAALSSLGLARFELVVGASQVGIHQSRLP